MDDHDPDDGTVRVYANPVDSMRTRSRTRTSAHGVPVVMVEVPSRAVRQPTADDSGALDPLDARIDARFEANATRRFRRLWRGIAAVAGTAIVALGAAGKAALDDARTEGADKVRLQVIERDLERTRMELERANLAIDALRTSLYRSVYGRRADQPDVPVTGASPKGTP